jgi:uncharacterized protein (DUF1810 family)
VTAGGASRSEARGGGGRGFGLDRFRRAQDAPHAGFAAALEELRAGRKAGHWIWYVFPQLAGLGQSPTAVHYGLDGRAEATAYLRDPVLGERLVAAARAVRAHLEGPRPQRLEELMGSRIDALKLVSCMTLFVSVARALHASEGRPEFAALAEDARVILDAAAAQGFHRCAFTEERLRAERIGGG